MSDIRAAMRLIGGIEPTPEQVQRVQAIAHSLGVSDNDPMLSILLALDCYHGVFNAMPERIKSAADLAATAAADQAKLAADRAVGQAITHLTPAVEKAMGEVVSRVATRQMLQWAAGALAVAAICIGLTFWYAHSTGTESGYQAGYGAGYTEAKDEKAAATWANTPQGKSAYRLAQAGSLDALVNCNRPGWSKTKNACYVQAAPDNKTYGWALP